MCTMYTLHLHTVQFTLYIMHIYFAHVFHIYKYNHVQNNERTSSITRAVSHVQYHTCSITRAVSWNSRALNQLKKIRSYTVIRRTQYLAVKLVTVWVLCESVTLYSISRIKSAYLIAHKPIS